MASRKAHQSRKNRESLSKKLGKVGRQIKARDNHECAYCQATAESSGAHLHLDHLVPRSAGGQDVATNLVLACYRCNTSRQDMPLTQWVKAAAQRFGLIFTAKAIRAQANRPLEA
jgi:5-methylcytosine-specific restriction endonuclease McrA